MALNEACRGCVGSSFDTVEEAQTTQAPRELHDRLSTFHRDVIGPTSDRLPNCFVERPKLCVADIQGQRPQQVVEDGIVTQSQKAESVLDRHHFENRDDAVESIEGINEELPRTGGVVVGTPYPRAE